jgi:hypothetical protein
VFTLALRTLFDLFCFFITELHAQPVHVGLFLKLAILDELRTKTREMMSVSFLETRVKCGSDGKEMTPTMIRAPRQLSNPLFTIASIKIAT